MILKGFTLVELLIVIAILSILSTIGVANFRSARLKAMDAGRKSDLQTIAKSLEAYANDHRKYPLGTNGEITCTLDSICHWGDSFSDGNITYAVRLPQDPGIYSYTYVSNNGSDFALYAHLENLNDPSVIDIPDVTCGGTNTCNYKITSSNIQ